jgi:hypothetical protein
MVMKSKKKIVSSNFKTLKHRFHLFLFSPTFYIGCFIMYSKEIKFELFKQNHFFSSLPLIYFDNKI